MCMCVSSIITSWEVSAIGHPVVLPVNVCEELLQVIDDSHATLPASMRCMRSYEVRWLLCTVTGNGRLSRVDSWHSNIFFDISKMLTLILSNLNKEMLKVF